jgi:hypothetical protein
MVVTPGWDTEAYLASSFPLHSEKIETEGLQIFSLKVELELEACY